MSLKDKCLNLKKFILNRINLDFLKHIERILKITLKLLSNNFNFSICENDFAYKRFLIIIII